MVATELAVFLLGEIRTGAGVWSLEVFLESHENGLVNFLLIGAGTGAGAVGARLAEVLLGGDSLVGGGDQGMAGRALVMLLLKDLVLDASFSTTGLLAGDASAPSSRKPLHPDELA
jgi:hypothetical protein